jgi:hypothetical protein
LFRDWICRIATLELGRQNRQANATMICPECGSFRPLCATFATVMRQKVTLYSRQMRGFSPVRLSTSVPRPTQILVTLRQTRNMRHFDA